MRWMKKNKLAVPARRPRLTAGREEWKEGAVFRDRFRRWSTLYLGTALAVVLGVFVLLLCGSVSKYALHSGSFLGRGAETMMTALLKQDFFDLSGGRTDDGKKGPIEEIVDALENILFKNY